MIGGGALAELSIGRVKALVAEDRLFPGATTGGSIVFAGTDNNSRLTEDGADGFWNDVAEAISEWNHVYVHGHGHSFVLWGRTLCTPTLYHFRSESD
jgi:hypothetical protein